MSITTGIEGLDKILGGGIPENSTVLLVGPPGCGKTTLSQQYIYSGLKKSQPSFYIALDSSPEDVIKTMEKFKWDLEPFMKKKKMSFIDAYSWKVGGGKASESVKVIKGGLDINSINLAIAEILDTGIKRGVFDSLSTLLLYTPPELVIRFVPVMIAKIKRANSTHILILEEGVHDDKLVNTLSYMVDCVINMKMEGNVRLIQVSKVKGTPYTRDWFTIKITKSGLVIGKKGK